MSFLKLHNIEVGYSINKEKLAKIGLKGLRVYVAGNNLFTISDFKLWDPELDTSDSLKYPAMRSVLAGVSFNF